MTDTAAPMDPTSFLMQSGARAFRFERPGDAVTGEIVDLQMQQQRDIKTNELKFWPDGNPMRQLRVTLRTDLRESDDDDGLRSVYVRGQLQQAARDAIKAAGAESIEVGGFFGVQYVKDGEPTQRGFNPPKQYRCQYKPPAAQPTAVAADDLF